MCWNTWGYSRVTLPSVIAAKRAASSGVILWFIVGGEYNCGMAQNPSSVERRSTVDASLKRHGGLSYLQIPAVDPRRSAAFYTAVLSWRISDGDTDHPKFMDQTGHLLGRWTSDRMAGGELGFVPYFYVDRIDEVVARVTANGGEIIKPICPEGDLFVATVRDPAGNVIGLWQEAG